MCLRAKLHQERCFLKLFFEGLWPLIGFSRKPSGRSSTGAAAQAQVEVETFQVNMLRKYTNLAQVLQPQMRPEALASLGTDWEERNVKLAAKPSGKRTLKMSQAAHFMSISVFACLYCMLPVTVFLAWSWSFGLPPSDKWERVFFSIQPPYFSLSSGGSAVLKPYGQTGATS